MSDCRSAGSFFKNPILSPEQYQALKDRAAAKNLQIPSYPALDAQKKVSAAWLVEHSGFSRGYSHGPVGISRKHALAIVNRGNATASDILAFKDDIQQRVQDIWGIVLEPEPVFVGVSVSGRCGASASVGASVSLVLVLAAYRRLPPQIATRVWYFPCVGVGTRSGPGGSRLYLLIGNSCRLFKDCHKHRARQFSRLSVLVGGMIGGQ